MPWQPKMNVRFFSILWFMLLRDVTCIVCLCVRQFDLKWLIEWGFDIEAYIVTNWYDDRFHARYTCAINVECFFEWVVMNIKIKWSQFYHLNMVCERKMYVFIAEYADCGDQPFELIIKSNDCTWGVYLPIKYSLLPKLLAEGRWIVNTELILTMRTNTIFHKQSIANCVCTIMTHFFIDSDLWQSIDIPP